MTTLNFTNQNGEELEVLVDFSFGRNFENGSRYVATANVTYNGIPKTFRVGTDSSYLFDEYDQLIEEVSFDELQVWIYDTFFSSYDFEEDVLNWINDLDV